MIREFRIMMGLLTLLITWPQHAGAQGRFDNLRLNENSVLIRYQGDAKSSASQIDAEFLMGAAEYTMKAGYDYFVFRVDKPNQSTTTPEANTANPPEPSFQSVGAMTYQPSAFAKSDKRSRESIVLLFRYGTQQADAFDAKLMTQAQLQQDAAPAQVALPPTDSGVPVTGQTQLPPANQILPPEDRAATTPLAPSPQPQALQPSKTPTHSPPRYDPIEMRGHQQPQTRVGVTAAVPLSSTFKFPEARATNGVTTLRYSMELEFERSVVLGFEVSEVQPHSWGYVIGGSIEPPRALKSMDVTMNGQTSSFYATNDSPTLQFVTAYASAVYQWEKVYVPFGLNYVYPNFEPGQSDYKYTYEGSIGAQLGIGLQINPHFSVELHSWVHSMSMKAVYLNVVEDYGMGTESNILLRAKINLY